MFLSRDQIAELTGYVRASKQLEWLRKNGIRHWVGRTGRPVVPCSAIDGTPTSAHDSKPFELGHVA